MSTSTIVRGVYQDVRHHLGIEHECYRFRSSARSTNHVDVLVHRPSTLSTLTMFSTAGMATAVMPKTAPSTGFGGLAELRFFRRGSLAPREEHEIAGQLAAISRYPWTIGKQLNWGHMVGLAADFPGFVGCRWALLSAPFNVGMQDCMWIGEQTVRILYVVPITASEKAHAVQMRPGEFIHRLMAEVDIAAPRPERRAER